MNYQWFQFTSNPSGHLPSRAACFCEKKSYKHIIWILIWLTLEQKYLKRISITVPPYGHFDPATNPFCNQISRRLNVWSNTWETLSTLKPRRHPCAPFCNHQLTTKCWATKTFKSVNSNKLYLETEWTGFQSCIQSLKE